MPATVNKPAGLPVFPPHADPTGDCVLRSLLVEQPWRSRLGWPDGFAGGIAHRLDISTSGALLVADDVDDLARIRTWFRERQLVKTYRFRTRADVPWSENTCARAIAHDRRRKDRMVVQRGEATPHRGRWYPAETRFRRLAPGLFEAVMRTGVMHQIRVHAAFIGIPLAGDPRYGGGERPSEAPPGAEFLLHHLGLVGPGGVRTAPVPMPAWAITDEQGDRAEPKTSDKGV